jgi:uncharacterized protein (TIGR01777 family)
MRIVIAGGSGFLGTALTTRLLADGHDVVVLTRGGHGAIGPPGTRSNGPHSVRSNTPAPKFAVWQPDGSAGSLAREIDGADAIVNLAGAAIEDKRWTPARKKLLEESRVQSTRSLVAAVGAASRRPAVFIQGSAIGYYGAHEAGPVFDETSLPGDDFLARLSLAWERAAAPVHDLGCRLVIVRTGIVLAKHDGALAKMSMPFKLFAGGPVGSGRQYLSWIHLDDWVAVIVWALTNPAVMGPINATAPEPVPNRQFASALGRAMHRPSWAPVPGFVLRTIFGEMADIMLMRGQRVIPTRAGELGFTFKFERLDDALTAIYSRSRDT